MNPSLVDVTSTKEEEKTLDEDVDNKPVIPLRQRKLPASFWQEPSMSSSSTNMRESGNQGVIPHFMQHPLPFVSTQPWTTNVPNAMYSPFLSERIPTPSGLIMAQNSAPFWSRTPVGCCACSACMNYNYFAPRFIDAYGGLRYRSAGPCCPTANCQDQTCKLCSTIDSWHPDRIRQLRLRSARYNALVD